MKGENQSPQFDFGENFFKITKATEKPLTPPLPETAEQEKARVMREIMAEIPNLLIVDKHKVIRGPRKPGGNLVEISINQAVTFKKVPLPENPQKFKYQTCEPTWGIGLKYHNKIEISQGGRHQSRQKQERNKRRRKA